jgi:CubicO group peptidase (beta-lactamase class C family)
VGEPLAKYFPKFADMPVAVLDAKKEGIIEKVPAARKITIQDLFRHTSGLSLRGSGSTVLHKMYPSASNLAAEVMTGAQLLDRLSSLPLVYQPGAVWEYSFGLDVLGLVVESISQEPLGQYLTDNVWRPLGMADTGFVISAEKIARYAKALPNDPETGRPQPSRSLQSNLCAVAPLDQNDASAVAIVAMGQQFSVLFGTAVEVGVIAEELQAAGVVRGDQHLQHQGAEQPRQDFHRQEIFGTAADPSCAVERYPTPAGAGDGLPVEKQRSLVEAAKRGPQLWIVGLAICLIDSGSVAPVA